MNNLGGNPSPYSRDGSKLLYYHKGPTLRTTPGSTTSRRNHRSRSRIRWSPDCAAADMVEPYLVHYPSRDGKWTISAFAYVPNNIQRNGKFPAIVYIHGGPAAQSVNSFNRFIQYIVNQGYLVIAPNYRGSTGYGKEFNDANLAMTAAVS